ncbi:MAG TPA: hypothetical protein VLQ45_31510 [Thermoanaerobaculia bacterium]|nr:hypothetical protein [Thermoanaerobaculia bacterium]
MFTPKVGKLSDRNRIKKAVVKKAQEWENLYLPPGMGKGSTPKTLKNEMTKLQLREGVGKHALRKQVDRQTKDDRLVLFTQFHDGDLAVKKQPRGDQAKLATNLLGTVQYQPNHLTTINTIVSSDLRTYARRAHKASTPKKAKKHAQYKIDYIVKTGDVSVDPQGNVRRLT